jgi:hypothetical protein
VTGFIKIKKHSLLLLLSRLVAMPKIKPAIRILTPLNLYSTRDTGSMNATPES